MVAYWNGLQICHGVVIRTAVIGPRNALFDQGVADGPDGGRRNVGSTRQRTVRQEARIDVVEHVVVVGLAVRLRRIGQIFQIAHDRLDAGLEDVGAVAPVAVDRVAVDGACRRIRVRDQVGGRRDWIALAVAPEFRVAGAEHEVVGAGATMERLMEVVAQGEAVSQHLQDRSLLLLRVVEAHRVAEAPVARRVGRHHEGEKVGEAARVVGLGGAGGGAILLLPILVEAVRGIAGVVIVGEVRPLQRERTGERAGAGDAGVERIGRQASEAGGQDVEVSRIHVLLNARLGDRLERRASVAWRGRGAFRVGLRHCVGGAIGRLGDRRNADIERRLGRDRELLRLREVRTRRTVLVDDALRQQVRDGLALALGLVDAEGMIETAVFTDQDDDVLDRRSRLDGLRRILLAVGVVLDLLKDILNDIEAIGMLTLVPVATAPIGGVARGCDRHRRCDAKRSRRPPSCS